VGTAPTSLAIAALTNTVPLALAPNSQDASVASFVTTGPDVVYVPVRTQSAVRKCVPLGALAHC
jgi:hypothetical protein